MLKRPLMRPRDRVRCEEWRALPGEKSPSQKREILTADIKQPGRNGKSLEQDKFFFIHQATLGRRSPPFIYLAGSPSPTPTPSSTSPPPTCRRRSSPGAARCDRPFPVAAAAAAAAQPATATFALPPSTTCGDRRARVQRQPHVPASAASYVQFHVGPPPAAAKSVHRRRSSRHRPRSVGAVAATPRRHHVSRVALNRHPLASNSPSPSTRISQHSVPQSCADQIVVPSACQSTLALVI